MGAAIEALLSSRNLTAFLVVVFCLFGGLWRLSFFLRARRWLAEQEKRGVSGVAGALF